MTMSATTVRRGLFGMFAGGLSGLWIGSHRDAGRRRRTQQQHQLHAERHSDHR